MKLLGNSIEFHGAPWRLHGDSMELHGTPWSSMETPSHSMELHEDSMELHGAPWRLHGIPCTFHGIPFDSIEFHSILWNSMEFYGIPWNSMEFHGVISHGEADVFLKLYCAQAPYLYGEYNNINSCIQQLLFWRCTCACTRCNPHQRFCVILVVE